MTVFSLDDELLTLERVNKTSATQHRISAVRVRLPQHSHESFFLLKTYSLPLNIGLKNFTSGKKKESHVQPIINFAKFHQRKNIFLLTSIFQVKTPHPNKGGKIRERPGNVTKNINFQKRETKLEGNFLPFNFTNLNCFRRGINIGVE